MVDNLAKDFLQELGLPKGSYPFIIYTNLIVNRVVLPDGEDIMTEIPIYNGHNKVKCYKEKFN